MSPSGLWVLFIFLKVSLSLPVESHQWCCDNRAGVSQWRVTAFIWGSGFEVNDPPPEQKCITPRLATHLRIFLCFFMSHSSVQIKVPYFSLVAGSLSVEWEWFWEALAGRWLKAVQLYYGSCRDAHKQTTSGSIRESGDSGTFITLAKQKQCVSLVFCLLFFVCCYSVSLRFTYALICCADGLQTRTLRYLRYKFMPLLSVLFITLFHPVGMD